ncbi:hypothetical protein Cycma_3446 [Cyclobacterium marinum DSM 745]|nr:hypothetical protein Cycma_3446 [Cyclobacterium marinum DSM 745]
MVAAKNLCSYVSIEKFLVYSEAYFKSIFQKNLNNTQTQLMFSG